MIGDNRVVISTMITTGAKKTSESSPTEIPFCATIRATSPRHTIPAPICKDSLFPYLQINAPRPHPAIFDTTAIIDDILGIVLLSIMTSLGGASGFHIQGILMVLLKMAAFFVISIIGGFGIKKFFEWLSTYKNPEIERHRRRCITFISLQRRP